MYVANFPLRHKLTDDEKKAYIDAELCIMNSPPKSDTPLAQNRWDELVYIHLIQSNFVHDVVSGLPHEPHPMFWVYYTPEHVYRSDSNIVSPPPQGQFLPWHRYYMKTHETILQQECNYTGAQPYWDEMRDADASYNISDSVVFDPDTGFGGEGGDCVTDGPFVNLTLHLTAAWGNVSSSSFCLSRSFNNNIWQNANSTNTNPCLESANYTEAASCFPSNPHTAGHGGVGGTMLDVSGSPGDPLFFLHHTNLDRLWWKWQQASPENRTYDIGQDISNLPTYEYLIENEFVFPGALLQDAGDTPYNVTTLNHTLWMGGVMPNVTVGDVMDLGADTICAEYIEDDE